MAPAPCSCAAPCPPVGPTVIPTASYAPPMCLPPCPDRREVSVARRHTSPLQSDRAARRPQIARASEYRNSAVECCGLGQPWQSASSGGTHAFTKARVSACQTRAHGRECALAGGGDRDELASRLCFTRGRGRSPPPAAHPTSPPAAAIAVRDSMCQWFIPCKSRVMAFMEFESWHSPSPHHPRLPHTSSSFPHPTRRLLTRRAHECRSATAIESTCRALT
jgi:hypothetical protein